MAYFAIYNKHNGEIENVVECPEFLKSTIHLEENQIVLQVDFQVSNQKYRVKDGELTLIS